MSAVEAALERLRADDLGAIVRVREAALQEARDARGPLAGMPFTAKAVLAVGGEETNAASGAFLGHVPAADAPAIARLRAAGAVLVGITNCSELALSAWTGNPLYPETRHPSVPGRSPGGSSGGCAAAVAAGHVPFSLGTDYGGSVRLPAACCGVVGLRPTPGRIPAGGQVPGAPPGSPRARFSLVGPLAADVPTLAAVFAVLAGSQPVTAAESCDPVTEVPPWLDEAAELFTAIRDLDTFSDLRPVAHRLGPQLQELIARAPLDADPGGLEGRVDRVRAEADRFLAKRGMLLLPVATCELPPPAGAPVPFAALAPSRAVTLLGLPAVSIGGMQLVGARGRDEDVIAAALALAAQG